MRHLISIGILLVFLIGCSKNKPNSPEEISSSSLDVISSSSFGVDLPSHVRIDTWAVSTRWYVADSLPAGDTLMLCIPVLVGHQYRVQWDDTSEGSGSYNSDLYVNGMHGGESSEYYWWLAEDNGYETLHTLLASEDTLWVMARAYHGGDFAIRVLDLGIPVSSSSISSAVIVSESVSSSSALEPSSAFASSSVLLLSSSSAEVLSSSEIISSSMAASSSSAPGIYGSVTGGILPISEDWTLVLRNRADPQEFQVPCTIGDALVVEWVELGGVNPSTSGPVPSINILVEAMRQSTSLWGSPKDSMSTAPVLNMKADTLKLSITTNTSGTQLGFFYLRVRPAHKRTSLLTDGAWHRDSLARGDTLQVSMGAHAGYNYIASVQTDSGTFDIAWGESGTPPVLDGVANLSVWSSSSLIPTSADLQLLLAGIAKGSFQYRIQEVPILGAAVLLPDGKWLSDHLADTSSVVYNVKVTQGVNYVLQWWDSHSQEYNTYFAHTSVQVVNAYTQAQLWTSARTAGWSPQTILPTSDSIQIIVKTELAYTWYAGPYVIRLLRADSLRHVAVRSLSEQWVVDSISLSDSLEYHFPVDSGKYYRFQWQDATNGVDGYTADIVGYLYQQDSSSSWGETDSYDKGLVFSPKSKQFNAKFYSSSQPKHRDAYAYRIYEVHPKPMTIGTWIDTVIAPGQMLSYELPKFAIGTALTLEYQDASVSSSGKSAWLRMSYQGFTPGNTGIIGDPFCYDNTLFGGSQNLVVTDSTMLLNFTPRNTVSAGTFSFRVVAN